MDSLSDDGLVQILQKQIDALIFQVNDARQQLLQTEDRLETKIKNLLNEVETKEAKHQEEIIHLNEEIKELHGKIGTNYDEFKSCIDLEVNSLHRSTHGFIDNKPAPYDTSRNNHTDGSPFDSGNIKSEKPNNSDLPVKDVTKNEEFKDSFDLEDNSSHRLTGDFIENDPDPNDTSRNNQTDRSPVDSENIKSERPDLLSVLSRFSSRFHKMVGPDEAHNLHTSESFHMYSAATISDPSNNCVKVWLITSASVVITMLQFIILSTLIIDATNPTCTSNQNCRVGEYCDFKVETQWKWTPRCHDCSYLNDYAQTYNISNCSSVLEGHKDMSHPDYAVVDHMDIAWEVNLDYTDIEEFCFAQLHCDETDLLKNRCDYFVNEFNKWHITQMGTLIFMSFLLAVLISRDVQDALAEESYLNHGLRCNSVRPSSHFAADVLRMTLRARQIVLPWYAGAAAVSIIITDTLDTKNIMLNLLTIDVILIADDMLATLFLPLLDQSSTEKLMKSSSHHKVKVSMVWSRVHGILVAIVLVIAVGFFEPLMITLSPKSDEGCAAVFWVFFLILTGGPAIVTFLHGVGHVLLDRKSATKCKAIMRGIGEVILDLGSWTCFCSIAPIIVINSIYVNDVFFIQALFLGLIYLLCLICFQALKLYTSWQPIQALSVNLFGV